MKRNLITLLAAMTVLSLSCNKNELQSNGESGDKNVRTISATAEITTKVAFAANINMLAWNTGDKFAVYTESGDKNVASTGYISNTPFTFQIDGKASTFTAYYPYSESGSSAQTIPTSQNWYKTNFPTYYPLKGEGTVKENNTSNIVFEPMAAALQLKIFGGETDETLTQVTLKYSTAVYYLKPGSNNRKISLDAASSSAVTDANKVYLLVEKDAVLPVGSVFTIETSKATYEYVTKQELNLTNIDFQPVPFDLTKGKVDYYESGIMIEGVSYSKTTDGASATSAEDAVTISSTNGVYFISENTNLQQISGNFSNLVVIGRYSNSKPTVKFGTSLNVNGAGSIIFKNVKIDMSAKTSGSYMIGMSGISEATEISNFIFEDCEMILPTNQSLLYWSANVYVSNAVLRNNIIRIPLTENKEVQLFNFAKAPEATQKVTIENNLIYTNSTGLYSNGKLLTLNNNGKAQDGISVSIKNNTLVNIGANPLVLMYKGTNQTIEFSGNFCIFNTTGETPSTTGATPSLFTFNGADNKATPSPYTGTFTYADNHYSYNGINFQFLSSGVFPSGFGSQPSEDFPSVISPFDVCKQDTGEFVLKNTYVGYGSSLVPVAE